MICVSTYEWMRPASSGSLLKSMPGHDVRGAERDLLGLGEEVVGIAVEHHACRPGRTGTSSSGMILVASSTSKLNCSACSSVKICSPSSHSGYSPASIASHRSRRWKSGSAPEILTGLVPDQRMRAQQRLPVELDETRFALRIDEPERVHAEALHHAEAAREWRGPTSPTSACAWTPASARRNPRTCRGR